MTCVVNQLTDLLQRKCHFLETICWSPTLQCLMCGITVDLVKVKPGIPGYVCKLIQKSIREIL